MNDTPAFYVPYAKPENLEGVYAAFAKMCSKPIPPMSERVFSSDFTHISIDWTATVGQTLTGKGWSRKRSKNGAYDKRVFAADPALVLAIFPGVPFIVVTNHRLVGSVGSTWENPFFAGSPTHVEYFRVASGAQ